MYNEIKPRKRPRQQRSKAVVDAIIEAATRIWMADGFSRMTTNQVAELAGVSIGSLYQYFPNKEAICYAVSEQLFEEFTTSYLDALHSKVNAPFDTKIRQLVNIGVDIAIKFPRHDTSNYHEFIQFGGFDPLKKSREVLIPELANLLAEQPDGLRPKHPEYVAYISLTAVSEVIADVFLRHPEWMLDPEFIDHLHDTVIGFWEKSILTPLNGK